MNNISGQGLSVEPVDTVSVSLLEQEDSSLKVGVSSPQLKNYYRLPKYLGSSLFIV